MNIMKLCFILKGTKLKKMKYYHLLLFVSIIACKQSPTVSYKGDLDIGIAKDGFLANESAETYHLSLDSNSYVYGFVDQISVDVVVKLYDEDEKVLGNFDGPKRGPEQFSFEISKTGDYKLEISPFKEETGDYKITLLKVEPLASGPADRVDQLFTFYKGDHPGAAVGVMQDGQLIFSKAYGKAELRNNIDFQHNTPSNIGSVTKQFTAFSILLLEKEGLLSIDDDVREHIPELPDFGKVITIKHLMDHHL